jgi:tRNA-splicing endonuclease subunit Sen15
LAGQYSKTHLHQGSNLISKNQLASIKFSRFVLMSASESTLSTPSALTNFFLSEGSFSTHPSHLRHLALQIQHNLQYQHRWANLRIHTHSLLSLKPLARPIISGLPPRRLYVHPDEQIEMLTAQAARNKMQEEDSGQGHDQTEDDTELTFEPEEEWVLPTHLREEWSLQQFAEIFDNIGITPPVENRSSDGKTSEQKESPAQTNKWRTTKRMVLATLQDDSTVVYYIVHDGIVKPRQN